MKILLSVLIFIFGLQYWAKADNIRDFEIEGMSLYESALNFFSQSEIRDNEENLAKLSLKQNNLSTDINAVNIEITEIKTNKSSLLDNTEFEKSLIMQAIKDNDTASLESDELELEKIKS